jgi:hypothetical protein
MKWKFSSKNTIASDGTSLPSRSSIERSYETITCSRSYETHALSKRGLANKLANDFAAQN